ncbi:hypothetical protein J6590_072597 [Homalodisca vitripennis]|nr:hypothetical protein J6590_072597 [Homalodisca vitripennis]
MSVILEWELVNVRVWRWSSNSGRGDLSQFCTDSGYFGWQVCSMLNVQLAMSHADSIVTTRALEDLW